MESVTENWKPVVGFENKFLVSDLGQVKALPWERRHWCGKMIPQPETIVKQSRHSGGYRIVALRDGKKYYVHRLVMAAFLGESSGQDVNHIDGDKSNNRLENLEYCDRLHNVRHAIATGLQNNAGEGNGMHRYTEDQIRRAYYLVKSGASHGYAAAATGVGVGTVQQVVTGVRWQHLGLVTSAGGTQ